MGCISFSVAKPGLLGCWYPQKRTVEKGKKYRTAKAGESRRSQGFHEKLHRWLRRNKIVTKNWGLAVARKSENAACPLYIKRHIWDVAVLEPYAEVGHCINSSYCLWAQLCYLHWHKEQAPVNKRVQHTVKPLTPSDAVLISKTSQPFLWLCLHCSSVLGLSLCSSPPSSTIRAALWMLNSRPAWSGESLNTCIMLSHASKLDWHQLDWIKVVHHDTSWNLGLPKHSPDDLCLNWSYQDEKKMDG